MYEIQASANVVGSSTVVGSGQARQMRCVAASQMEGLLTRELSSLGEDGVPAPSNGADVSSVELMPAFRMNQKDHCCPSKCATTC